MTIVTKVPCRNGVVWAGSEVSHESLGHTWTVGDVFFLDGIIYANVSSAELPNTTMSVPALKLALPCTTVKIRKKPSLPARPLTDSTNLVCYGISRIKDFFMKMTDPKPHPTLKPVTLATADVAQAFGLDKTYKSVYSLQNPAKSTELWDKIFGEEWDLVCYKKGAVVELRFSLDGQEPLLFLKMEASVVRCGSTSWPQDSYREFIKTQAANKFLKKS